METPRDESETSVPKEELSTSIYCRWANGDNDHDSSFEKTSEYVDRIITAIQSICPTDFSVEDLAEIRHCLINKTCLSMCGLWEREIPQKPLPEFYRLLQLTTQYAKQYGGQGEGQGEDQDEDDQDEDQDDPTHPAE